MGNNNSYSNFVRSFPSREYSDLNYADIDPSAPGGYRFKEDVVLPWPVKLTTYEGMTDTSGTFRDFGVENTPSAIKEYLSLDRDNAVIIRIEDGPCGAIWNGPPGQYYFQWTDRMEDPNDVVSFETIAEYFNFI
jgi:hypothetical protein